MSNDANEERDFDVRQKQYEMTIDERKLELGFFWQRSLFFWGFISVSFIGFAALKDQPESRLYISCFGVICSLTWTLGNRGSKYWYEAWEQKSTSRRFRSFDGGLYKMNMPIQEKYRILSARRYSVTRLAIALSDFTFIGWTMILVREAEKQHWSESGFSAFAALLLTGCYALVLLIGGRFSGEDRNSN